jgi:hypothetical protein
MKQILLIVLTVFAITSGSYAQAKKKPKQAQPLIAGDTAQQIRDINKLASQIKKDTVTYKKVVKDLDADKYRWHFYKGKELKLVETRGIDENNDMSVDWYFNNGQLIFSEQNWRDAKTKKLLQNQKMYLKNEILFAWISSVKGMVDTTSLDFQDVAAGLKRYAKELKEGDAK